MRFGRPSANKGRDLAQNLQILSVGQDPRQPKSFFASTKGEKHCARHYLMLNTNAYTRTWYIVRSTNTPKDKKTQLEELPKRRRFFLFFTRAKLRILARLLDISHCLGDSNWC
ncbi:uncharacterized protein TrAtP1_005153 [Trichoderma atroviride]|uniref:uncharacterized protein n=1 Tax=Hypocrea atroviridis TaxID=63577 RepID=UPI003324AECF|nr:hypothetical protein TrAtP1_005153 [Trichoderma atroviride]